MDDFLERPPLEHITYKITNLRFQQKNHEIFFSPVLSHEGVVDKSLDEQGEGDDVEDKDVEDALSVVLEVCSEHVPLLQEPMSVSFSDGINCKTLHSRNICVGIQIILTRSFTVQTNCEKITLKIFEYNRNAFL